MSMTTDKPDLPIPEDMILEAGEFMMGTKCISLVDVRQLLAQQEATHKAAMVEERRRLFDELRAVADRQYCRYIDQLKRPECLGAEYKIEKGTFGMDELRGHEKANHALGAHQGIYAAIEAIGGTP